jgi:hypothetical protein
MIRSLFNLNYKINKHISNLHPQEKFKLLDVKPILEQYKGEDWMDFKKDISLDSNYNYKRVPIVFEEFNQNRYDRLFGMYLIAWNPFCHTSVHNHPEGGCLMKILNGNIIEQRFMNAESFSIIDSLSKGDVSYIHDDIGLHRILNENNNTSYSLNIYSPNLDHEVVNLKHFKEHHDGTRRVTDYPIM